MNRRLIECVPNISEGRDRAKIDAIAAVVETVEGVRLLDVDPGKATNRTVITFVGEPEPVIEAAFRLMKKAQELIDMRATRASTHASAPRMCAHWCPSAASAWRSGALSRRSWPNVWARSWASLCTCTSSPPAKRNAATWPTTAAGEYEGLAQEAEGPRLEARLRSGGVHRERGPQRRHRHRRAQFPGGLQREPQHHEHAPCERHRLRHPRSGPQSEACRPMAPRSRCPAS
jgi:hypothetical protein